MVRCYRYSWGLSHWGLLSGLQGSSRAFVILMLPGQWLLVMTLLHVVSQEAVMHATYWSSMHLPTGQARLG